jgi:hypothetical protein
MADQVRSTVDDFEEFVGDPEEEEGNAGDPTSGEDDADENTSEGEEGDDEGDAEGEAQSAESDGPKYRVKVNGAVEEVPLQELINGYQRTADYTRKTQQLADARKAQDAEIAAVRAERERYSQVLVGLEQRLRSTGPEPNWDQLRATDPVAFATTWAEHQRRAAEIGAVQAERQRVADLQAAHEQEIHAEFAQAEASRLLEVLPKWKDPKVASAERRAIVEYGLSNGFSAEELSQVVDHRAVLMLHKAMRYDQIRARQGNTRQQVAEAPPAPVRGTAVAPGRSGAKSQLTVAKNRLAQTGRVRDAAAVFEKFL